MQNLRRKSPVPVYQRGIYSPLRRLRHQFYSVGGHDRPARDDSLRRRPWRARTLGDIRVGTAPWTDKTADVDAEPNVDSHSSCSFPKDPINPFGGGEVEFLGLLNRGKVRSSRESGQYLADLNNIIGSPETSESQVSDGFHVEQVLWRNDSKIEVELVAIHGGGHGIPQPYWRYPRLLGPAPREPNGPAVILAFVEQQRPR